MKKSLISFQELISLDNLIEAWSEFIYGKRNKKDVQVFSLNLSDQIVDLHNDLANGRYTHGPYQHFPINDPKPRSIHKATVRDRLLHHALHRKLYPAYAPLFIAGSFSCQEGKGLHAAINRFQVIARKVSRNHTRTCWVLKGDIRKFFASVDHTKLMEILRNRIEDEALFRLLSNVIESFHRTPGKGIPLGNLTSQLFANIYMNELDQFVKQGLRIKHYLRYADDFVFLSHDHEELLSYIPLVQSFLIERLALSLHPDKLLLQALASGVDFLGWAHFPHHRVPRTKTRRRIRSKLHSSLRNETLQSYLGLLSHGNAFEFRESLQNDYWLWREKACS